MANPHEKKYHEAAIRILAVDIPTKKDIYSGLTRIKGVSWAISNAICNELKIDKKRKISTLTEQEIEKISSFIKNPKLPAWLLNRRRDTDTGIDKHIITTELDLQREFDIRKMKKLKTYRGIRHIQGQPVRGQRTRGHFRKKGGAVGVTRQRPTGKSTKGGEKK